VPYFEEIYSKCVRAGAHSLGAACCGRASAVCGGPGVACGGGDTGAARCRSGYPEFIARYSGTGDPSNPGELSGMDYQLAKRAMLFRRDQGKVVDLESFKALLRANDYNTDPYSGGNPWNAICSRGDLVGDDGGCYDTKVR
jgi:hypothetical protein